MADLGSFYRRTELKMAWTITNQGANAKVCSETGRAAWKNAEPLPAEPGAAAGFFNARIVTRNPAIPAVANRLVLCDFDRGDVEELLRRHGLELPAGAWRVKTANGMHAYASAPDGYP